MSTDSADDIQYAEDCLASFRARVEGIKERWVAFTALLDAEPWVRADYAKPDLSPLLRAVAAVAQDVYDATRLGDGYCRPTCGHREWLDSIDEEDPEANPYQVDDCTDDTCGCPCHVNEEWDTSWGRWRGPAEPPDPVELTPACLNCDDSGCSDCRPDL